MNKQCVICNVLLLCLGTSGLALSNLSFLAFAQNNLSLREQRQSLVASNIANVDTPGYKAEDIDFKQSLATAMTGGAAAGEVKFLKDFPVGLDGNDVSLTAEKVEAIKNNGAMNSEVTFLHQSTTDLITALRPNPNGI
jgi:flagellar basal-body rod protein FlgB